jgi:hypothetical protein
LDDTDFHSDVPNCKFASGDIQNDWRWLPAQPVDYVNVRGLFGFVDSWPEVFRKALRYFASWMTVP